MIFLRSGGLVATVLLAALSSSKVAWAVDAEETQEPSIACAKGHEFDKENGKCIPISCDAKDACDSDKEICRPFKPECDILPCPRFKCVPKERKCPPGTIYNPKSETCVPMTCAAPNACSKKEVCVEWPTKCTKENYPCKQYVCRKKCWKGKEYDPSTGECVPVTCEARNACTKKEECIPKKLPCKEPPCKRYVCERKCPTGKKYNPVMKKCVKVSCEARRACRRNETCVPTKKVCPTEAPCAQYICRRECPKGTVYHPLKKRCVPVSCDFVKACRDDETCVPTKVLCKDGPCAQFECKKRCPKGTKYDSTKKECVPMTCEAPNACGPNQICTSTNVKCVREPCPQYECKDIMKECPEGNVYDRKSGECVPVSCQASNACANDEICVPSRKPCDTTPCQNFFCTKCLRQVRCKPCKNGYVYDENKCQTCECLPEITSVTEVTATP